MPASSLRDLYLHQTLSALSEGEGGWLFQVTTADEDGDSDHTGIWLLDRAGRVKRLTTDDAQGAVWSCLGDEICFIRSVDSTPQMFTLSFAGGEASQLGEWEDGIASIEQWDSERGRLLVIAHRGQKPGRQPFVVDHLPYKMDGIGYKGERRSCLYLFDEHERAFTPVVADGGDVIEAKWSPDRSSIAYVQRRDGAQRHRMDLWIKRGQQPPERLSDDLVSIGGLAWASDGQRLAFSGSSVEGSSVSWLMDIEVDTGRLHDYRAEVAVPGPIQWAEDDEALLFLQAYKGAHRVSKASRLASEAVPIVELDDAQVLDMAAIDGSIAYIAAGPNSGPDLHLFHQSTGHTDDVGRFNRWRRKRPSMRASRRYFTVPDGLGGTETVDGWLLAPSDEGPFPLLLDMHGGPHSLVMFEHETHAHWPALVRRGWAVLALNAVGTNSYGDEFARRLRGHWGERDLPQWLAAVEALREQGVANDELAVFGHSYGGFLSAWTLTQGVPLVCGVVSGGIIDMQSHTGTSDTGYYVGPYSLAGEPEEQRARYQALSPVSHVHRVRAPTLLLQGDDDQRCPLGQAEEFFARLIRHGEAKARMVVFPGGTHHVASTGRPSHRMAFYRHLVDWLQQHRGHVRREDRSKIEHAAA